MKVSKLKKGIIETMELFGLSKESAKLIANAMIQMKDDDEVSSKEAVKFAFISGWNFATTVLEIAEKMKQGNLEIKNGNALIIEDEEDKMN